MIRYNITLVLLLFCTSYFSQVNGQIYSSPEKNVIYWFLNDSICVSIEICDFEINCYNYLKKYTKKEIMLIFKTPMTMKELELNGILVNKINLVGNKIFGFGNESPIFILTGKKIDYYNKEVSLIYIGKHRYKKKQKWLVDGGSASD